MVWDVDPERWYNLCPDQVLPPDDGLHWTGPYKTRNGRCAACHATGYQRNYGARAGKYTLTTAEMGGQRGVPRSGLGASGLDRRAGCAGGWAAEHRRLWVSCWGGKIGDQQCATCHSRRESLLGGSPDPGTPFADAYTQATLRPGLYEADGQIKAEVYVYGSFLQSKMFARGFCCENCHNPHDAELKAEGNATCAQCHSPAGHPDFSTLTKTTYDSPDHTFHPVGSAGGRGHRVPVAQRRPADPRQCGAVAAWADLQTRLTRLMPLLSDRMRSVRIATAKQLLDTPPDQLAHSQGGMVSAAMGDWQKSLGNKLDYPETHLVIAGSALALRNFPAVLQAFQEVVRLDPQRADAWVMLVRITDATQGQPQARQVSLRALDKVPSDPGLMRLTGQIGR